MSLVLEGLLLMLAFITVTVLAVAAIVKTSPYKVLLFWRDLMFPPRDFQTSRLALEGDLPWEPWIHPAMWLGAAGAIIFGDGDLVPPIDGTDYVWLSFGIISPVLGFCSVWMLAYGTGASRYVAMWMRTIADLGIVLAIAFYEFEKMVAHGNSVIFQGLGQGFVPNLVMIFAAWYMSVLVWRDVKVLIAVEKLAASIHMGQRERRKDAY